MRKKPLEPCISRVQTLLTRSFAKVTLSGWFWFAAVVDWPSIGSDKSEPGSCQSCGDFCYKLGNEICLKRFCSISFHCSVAKVWVADRPPSLHPWPFTVWTRNCPCQVGTCPKPGSIAVDCSAVTGAWIPPAADFSDGFWCKSLQKHGKNNNLENFLWYCFLGVQVIVFI